MHLARVTGAVVSTQKSPSLIGKKLLLVRRISADGELPLTPLIQSAQALVSWYSSAVVPAPDMCFQALTRPSTWQWSALSIRFRAKELKDGNLYPNR